MVRKKTATAVDRNGTAGNGAKAAASAAEAGAAPPALLQWWLNVQSRLPPLRLGSLDVSTTLATIALLSSLRFLFTAMLVRIFGWPDEMVARDAAASLVGIFHSLLLVPALAACFLATPVAYSPHQATTHTALPRWYPVVVDTLLQFCTGYMLYDGTLNILVLKYPTYVASDWMFLGHHLATTLYMSSCRILKMGHQSAMMCMLLGEATNPFQNSFAVAELAQALACCQGALSRQLLATTEALFAGLYCLVRAGVGPPVCAHMTVDLWRRGAPAGIPKSVLLLWTLLIWAVLIGSIPWIVDCWAKFQKYLPPVLAAWLAGGAAAAATDGGEL